ncbi:MAG TPA: hypothetical protein DHW02_13530 [Ktedonobacter sp.]|nr:hypothetical protein [Ktedonobacter sp.]
MLSKYKEYARKRTMSRHLSNTEQFAALSRVGAALMSELDEKRLLHLIAETACELTGASFAAFTLRPTNERGQVIGPSEGNFFSLAAIVGVTQEQEKMFQRMSLGGEGLLAPIFRQGLSVLVPDVLAYYHKRASQGEQSGGPASSAARADAFAFVHGQRTTDGIHAVGLPRAHPVMRSFLGVPLLDRERQVRGGLLLGHGEPNCFTGDDEAMLTSLASQAAVAIENARLYDALQMRVQEMNAIFEHIADGVTLVDGQGRILRENSAARHLRETLVHSPQGRQALDALLYHPAQRALTGKVVSDSGSEEEEHGVSEQDAITVVDEAGGQHEAREYLVNASALHQAKPLSSPLPTPQQSTISGAVVVWHDVTEARRLLLERRARAESDARLALLQLVLDELPSSAYLVRGSNARLVLANHAVATVWGAHWQVGEPMADFLKEHGIRIFDVDGQPMATERLATLRAVRYGETVHQHQEVIRHPNGTHLPVLVNAVALKVRELYLSPADLLNAKADIEEPAAIVVHQDVTALKEADRLKDEFIGLAAHELRNPLAILKGYAQTLIVQTARGRGAELADWQLEALQSIDQSTSRLVELTEDLLDVTRLQAGRLELQMQPVNMVSLTQRLVARLQIMTDRHTISLHVPSHYLIVQVDPHRIEQVLSNLIGNAIKYSPEGGPIEITLCEDDEQHTMTVCIKDSGIGIPANQQGRLFGRFMRADNAQEYGIGGTGLGLYLCRELIERQSGRIWFESCEGKGSTFYISLPLVEAS